jgi:hypothetical protein
MLSAGIALSQVGWGFNLTRYDFATPLREPHPTKSQFSPLINDYSKRSLNGAKRNQGMSNHSITLDFITLH